MPISKLAAPTTPPPAQASGVVTLYRDTNWKSATYAIDTRNYSQGSLQSIQGSPLHDAASWIAYNLPVGIVMTMTDNTGWVDPKTGCTNLKGAGRVVDLVGTGQTEAVDLTKINMNDCISAFYYRAVNLGMGAVELFEDANFGGNRTILFLQDWPEGQLTSVDGWYIDDKLSSARWDTLMDSLDVSLFDNVDGSGASYTNIAGWLSSKSIADFSVTGFNDKMSSFKWGALTPMKEVVAPFTIPVSQSLNTAAGDTYTNSGTITNDTSEPQTGSVTLTQANAQSLTVTSSDSYTAGSSISVETDIGEDLLVESVSVKITVSVSFSYTHTTSTSNTATVTKDLSITQGFTAPAYTETTGTLIAKIGSLPPTTYNTTAQRWYQQPLTGTTLDPSNGWYQRTETLTLTVSGSLCGSWSTSVASIPLAHAMAN
jgi:hypothetical protein